MSSLKLKDKIPHLSGRCVNCRWKNICGGNLRLRAEAVTGDLWETDPACYLTDEEISPGPGDENMETISYNEPVHLDKI